MSETGEQAAVYARRIMEQEKLINELRELVRDGLRCMKEAKRRWAPTTTNSDADVWIERAEKALNVDLSR
jgi:hypothetical protein